MDKSTEVQCVIPKFLASYHLLQNSLGFHHLLNFSHSLSSIEK